MRALIGVRAEPVDGLAGPAVLEMNAHLDVFVAVFCKQKKRAKEELAGASERAKQV
jgi:hypothetical protein